MQSRIAGPAPLLLAWAAVLAAFVGLAAASPIVAPLPGDVPATRALQQLAAHPPVAEALDFASVAGGPAALAGIAIVLVVALLVRGMRLEASVLAGAFAMRLLQLALRDGLAWPNTAVSADATFIVPGGGFPSGHVLGQVLVLGLLFAWTPRLIAAPSLTHAARAACISMMLLGAAQRVAVGAHWPSEVVGAALLAMIYLLPALAITVRHELQHHTPEPAKHTTGRLPSLAVET